MEQVSRCACRFLALQHCLWLLIGSRITHVMMISQHLVDMSTENKNEYGVCYRIICAAAAAATAIGDVIIYHLMHLFIHFSPSDSFCYL